MERKILTKEDLEKLREKYKESISLREGGYKKKIVVHMGTCGIAAGARKVMRKLMEEIKNNDIKDVILVTAGCAGLCSKEPILTIEEKDKPPFKYCLVNEAKAGEIVQRHILKGEVIKDYLLAIGHETTI